MCANYPNCTTVQQIPRTPTSAAFASALHVQGATSAAQLCTMGCGSSQPEKSLDAVARIGVGALHGKGLPAEKLRYESLVESGQCLKLVPRANGYAGFNGQQSIALGQTTSGKPDGGPKAVGPDSTWPDQEKCKWLDQEMHRGSVQEAVTLAIDGDPSDCKLFVVNENVLYLHCDRGGKGEVMMHNWFVNSSGEGASWFPSKSRWKLRPDGKLQPLTHLHADHASTYVLGWKGKPLLVTENSDETLTFEIPQPEIPTGPRVSAPAEVEAVKDDVERTVSVKQIRVTT